MSYRDPILGQLVEPTGFQPALQLGSSAVAGEDDTRLKISRPKREHVSSVGIRSTLLGKQIIPVVPECDQPEIMNRRVRGGAVANDDTYLAPQRRQESAISSSGPCLGYQYGKTGGAKSPSASFGEPIKIGLVGDDDHRTPTAVGAGPRCAGQSKSPVTVRRRVGSYLPQRPRTPPGTKCRQEFRTGGIGRQRPGRMIIWRALPGADSLCPLSGRVPRWHGETHDIGECPGVVISHVPDQSRDVGSQRRLA